MKDFKNNSSSVLSRYARDSRLRKDSDNEDKPARRPKTENKSFGNTKPRTEQKIQGERGKKTVGERRTSFNPNFSKDNRLRGENRYSDERRNERKSKPFAKDNNRKEHESKSSDRRTGANRKFSSDRPKSYPKYNPNKPVGEMRLNRFVAQSGICSRREADEYISAGLVSVNGTIVTELGTKVQPSDEVRFNGERLKGEKNVYLLLNKPKGYVTTMEDDHAAHIVTELVKNACTERIYPVGRLDKSSLGLLLFTNDGDITRQLTHPSYLKKKVYEVELDHPLTRADFDKLADGVMLEDGEAFFDEISFLSDDKKRVGCEIHSGRNRIVRRMFDALGYSVVKLDRVYYAGLTKKNLRRGAWRFLTDDEVARLKSGRYE